MGVSFYACECCGESRYEEYVGVCFSCDASLCTSCLVNDDVNDNFAYSYGYKFDSQNPELMKKYEGEGFSLYDEDGEPYYKDGDIIDDSNIQEKYCPYCSGDVINESAFLAYIIKKFNINEELEKTLFKKKQ